MAEPVEIEMENASGILQDRRPRMAYHLLSVGFPIFHLPFAVSASYLSVFISLVICVYLVFFRLNGFNIDLVWKALNSHRF